MLEDQYDVIVVGAGSGDIGAALAASRLGLSVLLVEQADGIGGTAVRGGVHIWEMGVGGTGLPFDIYRRLKQLPMPSVSTRLADISVGLTRIANNNSSPVGNR